MDYLFTGGRGPVLCIVFMSPTPDSTLMAQNENGALKLRDISLSPEAAPLFAPLTLTVEPGRAATVMGPSGCGKSSLLAYICGTLEPVFKPAGEVELNGTSLRALPPEERHIGILFQDDLLFPHLSVGDNLAFGIPDEIRGRAQRQSLIESALEDADLAGMANRDPATLSGGQRARVALMRTLLSGPKALLLDEPFSKLDADLRARVREFVFAHAKANAIPTLLVTHDPADAEAAGGTVVELI